MRQVRACFWQALHALQRHGVFKLALVACLSLSAEVRRDIPPPPPISIHSQTRKYWVPPENVNQVKALIVRHLPVLVYGKSSKKAPELSILTKGEAVQTSDGQVNREGLAHA